MIAMAACVVLIISVFLPDRWLDLRKTFFVQCVAAGVVIVASLWPLFQH